MPKGAVDVAPPSLWRNPFHTGQESGVFSRPPPLIPDMGAEQAVELFRLLLTESISPEMYPHAIEWLAQWDQAENCRPLNRVPTLRGKDLCCTCKLYEPCHADVLLELANA